ncbi:hypothetical protein DFQ28_009655 [Apophysomyces sp. BC1034]|nr:hypothetical protein DFQ30_009902 [Apophysomyces sp. BC1015]KAG0182104.1 hypothetical protein DFQ29_005798 [Apophysomyces sp. BC1021]KAG0192250.1 hypothetical protein DFQ28_009655 [Apophysomyces sp. BC1034]
MDDEYLYSYQLPNFDSISTQEAKGSARSNLSSAQKSTIAGESVEVKVAHAGASRQAETESHPTETSDAPTSEISLMEQEIHNFIRDHEDPIYYDSISDFPLGLSDNEDYTAAAQTDRPPSSNSASETGNNDQETDTELVASDLMVSTKDRESEDQQAQQIVDEDVEESASTALENSDLSVEDEEKSPTLDESRSNVDELDELDDSDNGWQPNTPSSKQRIHSRSPDKESGADTSRRRPRLLPASISSKYSGILNSQPDARSITEEEFYGNDIEFQQNGPPTKKQAVAERDGTVGGRKVRKDTERGTDDVLQEDNNDQQEENNAQQEEDNSQQEEDSAQQDKHHTHGVRKVKAPKRPRQPVLRKQHTWWTDEEFDCLRKGLACFKGRQWNAIKKMFPVELQHRTNVQLKDKARSEVRRRIADGIPLGEFEYARTLGQGDE